MHRSDSVSHPRSRRLRRAVAGMVALAAAAAPLAVTPGAAEARKGNNNASVSDITMIQANVYTGLKTPRFQADVSTILSLQPDFVTYNEVPFRNDEILAPEGYDIYRDMTNRFTAATPVIWRSDRYTELAEGSFMLSNHRGRPPGRSVELGRRYANWVTLQDADGRVLSVVSAHVAPLVKGMPDLLRRSVNRLGLLVAELAPQGPVLVGGDFNVHFASGRYPRDLLTEYGLTPTYDVMGSYFPTGDHFGATIDYVFDTDVDSLLPDSQYPVELNSDHDAVVAGLSWQTDVPTTTQIVTNDPSASRKLRAAVLTRLVQGINAAEPGSRIALRTGEIGLVHVAKALRQALARGVRVRVVLSSAANPRPEHQLTKFVARNGYPRGSVRLCGKACRVEWRQAHMPRGFMMVSDATGAWTTRYDVNRTLSGVVLQQRTKVRVDTGALALKAGAELLRLRVR